MTLTPNFLPVGSVVEYNIGTTDKPEWSATVLDCQDLDWLVRSKDDFNLSHRPVPLTPEILTEWCGFERTENNYQLDGFAIDLDFKHCMIDGDGYHVYEEYCEPNQYLHQLQLCYLGNTQTVLPITIK